MNAYPYTGVEVQLTCPDRECKEFIELQERAKSNGYSVLKQTLADCMGKNSLHINMPCGHSVEYRTFDDIPEVDTPCYCGRKDHWFIKYISYE